MIHVLVRSALLVVALAAPSQAVDWQPFAEEDVIEILTRDEDGAQRETKVWIVVLDDRGWIRTNDSRWLANIRRGSEVVLRVADEEVPVAATENEDPDAYDRVEEAFKAKYGFMQSVMSTFRTSRPTLLEISPRTP